MIRALVSLLDTTITMMVLRAGNEVDVVIGKMISALMYVHSCRDT